MVLPADRLKMPAEPRVSTPSLIVTLPLAFSVPPSMLIVPVRLIVIVPEPPPALKTPPVLTFIVPELGVRTGYSFTTTRVALKFCVTVDVPVTLPTVTDPV